MHGKKLPEAAWHKTSVGGPPLNLTSPWSLGYREDRGAEFDQILEGRCVRPNFFADQTDRMQNFALMSNSETRLGEVTIPEGSTIFTGRGSGSTELRPDGRSQSDLPHGTT
jgi:hypothetical protein